MSFSESYAWEVVGRVEKAKTEKDPDANVEDKSPSSRV